VADYTFGRRLNENEINAEYIPWDSATFGFNVCNISAISINDPIEFKSIWSEFRSWLEIHNYKLVTTRFDSNKRKELEFLQANNFYIMENTCQPVIKNLDRFQPNSDIAISQAVESQIPDIIKIAQTSFQISRFHSDLKIDNKFANLRYANWINEINDLGQLKVATLGSEIVAFFLTERNLSESYWHLTAVSNVFKGKGYGKMSWEKMLKYEFDEGVVLVKSRISLDNLKILNLYGQLGAKFYNSEVSLHLHF
jgi:hypothetical protein